MRRLIASLGLLGFANLAFVQGSGSCQLGAESAQATATPTVVHAGHGGHAMPAPSGEEATEGLATGVPHGPLCLMMGTCALMLDVSSSSVTTGRVPDAGHVVGASVYLPASLTTAPDIPPPRA